MTATFVLDDRTADAIRQAINAASRGALAEACAIGDRALAGGGNAAALNAMLGMLRCQSGNLDTGIRHLRAAHEAQPADPKIAANLATALSEGGHHREALEVLTEDLARVDASMRLERLRGYLAQTLDDFPAAIQSYERVVAAAPSDWEAWNNLGNARRSEGDIEGSIVALRRAAKLEPESPPVLLNLALAIGAAGDLEESESQLRAIAADYPAEARPLGELHALLREQGRDEEALEAIEASVQRDPANIESLLALASQLSLLQRYDAAEAAYRRVIALDAANSLANLGLALVFELTNRREQLSKLVSEAEERGVEEAAVNFIRAFNFRREKRFEEGLKALDGVPDILETQRRMHLLGQLLEGVGRYDEAFAAFLRMNELGHEDAVLPEQRGANYRGNVRNQYGTVTPEWVGGWRQEKGRDPRPSPVFLVGFPRSGTTLLDTMLMGHPQIEVLEEEPALREAGALLPEFATLSTAGDEQIRAARDAYFRMAKSLTPLKPGNLLIDKNPLTMNNLPVARRLFPDAKVILALRHPCDVVLSCFITNFRANDGMVSFLGLDTAAELYDLSFSYLERVQELMKLPMHTITYENVVADQERELRPLFEFLELDWNDRVLEHESTAKGRGRIKTASYSQVVEPIYTRASGRWWHYRKHLEPAFAVLAPWVEKFGYSLDDPAKIPSKPA
ncbi:MAG: sulfotransferase [Sphingomonas sp.]|uniref:tetratricopeptide repeat-containing sulfotransferase family protein n=1 Tax=Sphingomonas sp. TaxID=28214 RepID=UPI0018352EF7|nr:tetratricopeptide repeat-containing sulfotransferase family protein [Sphingomonas sp.]MBA3666964.1 sulfotransferase [Sphingomonas sp.]